jgi:hypothetical protein
LSRRGESPLKRNGTDGCALTYADRMRRCPAATPSMSLISDRYSLIEEQDERILAVTRRGATPGKISVPRACFVSIAVVSTSNTKELIRD